MKEQEKKMSKDELDEEKINENEDKSKIDLEDVKDIKNEAETDTEDNESDEGAFKDEEDIKEELTKDSDKDLANEYLSKLQSLQAEFDNFRKREEKQRLVFKDIVTENLVQDLLPVVDNFERATLASKNESITLESFVQGMDMVHQQFESFLTNLKIQKMESLGEVFDPEKHDAVSKTPSDDYEEDHVSQVLQNGWELNEKVIRHAMVVVSSGKAESDKK